MTKIVQTLQYNERFLFSFGLILRIVNKIRRSLIGYTTPRTFSPRDIDRSVNYVLEVVSAWQKALAEYTGTVYPLKDKSVIEFGPGPDLGTGFIILALGARDYLAVDKNELIAKTSERFYEELFRRLSDYPAHERALEVYNRFQTCGFGDCFDYKVAPLSSLQDLSFRKFDVVVSQAVLEHLENVEEVFAGLRDYLNLNAVMIHEVDLATHTRWIRDLDPLNLLRYSDRIYNLLRFNGSPNRLRMSDYRKMLKGLGYGNIETHPIQTLNVQYLERAKFLLNKRFQSYSDEDLKVRSFRLLATYQKVD